MGKIHWPSEEWDRKRKRPVSVEIVKAEIGKKVSPAEKAYFLGKLSQDLEDSLNSPESLERLRKFAESLEKLKPYCQKIEPFVESSGLRPYLNEKRGIKDSDGVVYTDVHVAIAKYLKEPNSVRRWMMKASMKIVYGEDPKLVGLVERTLSSIDEYRKHAKVD
jgi:hypothetical protein